MAETITKETEEVEATATDKSLSVERPIAADDVLDQHLAEFDAKTAGEVEATPENVDQLLSDPVKAPVDPYDREAVSRANMESQAQRTAARLDQQLSEMQRREYERQEDADFAEFSKATQEQLSDYLVPPDFAEMFLIKEAVKDPLFRECWYARNDPTLDPQTMKQVRGYLRHVQDRVTDAAASIPDREATADYEMVAQAVRSAGGKAPTEQPPDFGRLSNRELNKFTREKFGFEAV
jgi:hypothetical protein